MSFVITVNDTTEEIASAVSGVGVTPSSLQPVAGHTHVELTDPTDIALISAKGVSKFFYRLATEVLEEKVDNRAIIQFDQVVISTTVGDPTPPTLVATRIFGSQSLVRLLVNRRGGPSYLLRLNLDAGGQASVPVDVSKETYLEIVDSEQGRVDVPVSISVETENTLVG